MELEYIETHLVDHCNLNCKGCGHFSPLSKEKYLDFKTFHRDIGRLSELFDNIHYICLMGGEPLLHPQITSFLDIARDVFPRAKIVIVTNGILLLTQSQLFWDVCKKRDVAIDITPYPFQRDYGKIVNAIKTHNVEFHLRARNVSTGQPVEHFDQYLNIKGDSDPFAAFQYCMSLYKCSFLQEGKIYLCRLPALIRIFNEYFGKNIPVENTDAINIFGDITGADIIDFLSRPSPFCRWCLTKYPQMAWGVSERRIEEWV